MTSLKGLGLSPKRLALTNAIAEVQWFDSNCHHGWHDDDTPTRTVCRSVGYVVRDDAKEIVLSESIDLMISSRFGCTNAIPKEAVIETKYLRRK